MRSKKLFKAVASFVIIAAMVAPLLLTSSTADAAMKFNKKSLSLTVGQSKKVKIKGFKKGSSASWKSSSAKIASVSGKGKKAKIKAVGAGTAKITCKVGAATVSGLTVKVRQKVTSFTMQDSSSKAKTSASLTAGETLVLKGAINGNKAGSTTNQTVKWSSSNSKVATVKKTNVNSAKVTAVSAGSATITATAQDGKKATCAIKVTGKSNGNSNNTKNTDKKDSKKPTPTPWVFTGNTIYKQHYEVTRWYNPDTTGAINGHKHDGYKNNTFAIWMVGFFDNPYSTNEDEINTNGGFNPALDEYKGKVLNIKGEFDYEGTNQKTILFQINYTSPSDYPILYKWEKGSNGLDSKYSGELKLKDNTDGTGGNALNAKTKAKMDLDFTIPTNAKNGDKDEATGKNYGIYLYFPNKPGGALAFVKDNTFHFRNFTITKK